MVGGFTLWFRVASRVCGFPPPKKKHVPPVADTGNQRVPFEFCTITNWCQTSIPNGTDIPNGSRVSGGPPAAPAESRVYVCTLWVGAGCQRGWAHCGVKSTDWEQGGGTRAA